MATIANGGSRRFQSVMPPKRRFETGQYGSRFKYTKPPLPANQPKKPTDTDLDSFFDAQVGNIERGLLSQLPFALASRAVENIPQARNWYWGLGKTPLRARQLWSAINPAHAPRADIAWSIRDIMKNIATPSLMPMFFSYISPEIMERLEAASERPDA